MILWGVGGEVGGWSGPKMILWGGGGGRWGSKEKGSCLMSALVEKDRKKSYPSGI